MKAGFRPSMAWLHTWAGLVVGWLLFAIFLTGTASYFRPEITRWMQPELHAVVPAPDAAQRAVARLQQVAPRANNWFIELPDDRDPSMQIFWREEGAGRRFQRETLNAGTGEPLQARATRGGDFFYRFHFELHMPPLWGRWVVGAAAMIMLVAIVSGVITHRRIFKDFFTFRPAKAGQRAWLDAHNALAVLALPYHLVITYTGMITLMTMYMPWGVDVAYDGNRQAFFAEMAQSAPPKKAAGVAAPLASMGPMLAQAEHVWSGARVSRISVSHPGDANATVQVTRHDGDEMSRAGGRLVFNGATGALLTKPEATPAAASTHDMLYGLHLGRFGGPLLRALFFLSGLVGTAMVATGLVLWAVKRQTRTSGAGWSAFGNRCVEALNVAAVTGLPLAMAAYFWGNRLLPVDVAARADAEIRCFFAVWIVAAIHAALRPGLRAWREQLVAAALLFGGLPTLNAITTSSHLANTLPRGDWGLAGVDLVTMAIGIVLGLVAWHVGWRRPQRAEARRVGRVPMAHAARVGAD